MTAVKTPSKKPTPEAKSRATLLIVAILGTMMASLDTSIVNVTLPSMMQDFHSDVHQIEWVVTAYMIGFAAFMPLTAWLRSRFGIRPTFIASLAVFLCGSVACTFSLNLASLIAGRIIQSFAAGALTPTGMAIVSLAFEPSERGRAFGYWGLGAVLGPTLGPPLGGILTEAFGWRSVFMVNMPIAVVAIILSRRVLRRLDEGANKTPSLPFDLVSFLSLTLGIVFLMLFVNQGGEYGWIIPRVVLYGIVAFTSLGVFTFSALKGKRAIIELSLFRYKYFPAAVCITVVRSFVLFGTTFLLPLYLQGPRELSVEQCGLLLLPGAVAIGLTMPISGRISDTFGARAPSIVGILLMLLAMVQFSSFSPETNYFLIILPTIFRGIGIGLLVTPLNAAAMNAVPRGKEGMASSILSLSQQLGGSFGIALLAAFFNSRIDAAGNVLSGASRQVLIGKTHGEFFDDAVTILTTAFHHTYVLGAVLVALAIIPACWLPSSIRKSKRKRA